MKKKEKNLQPLKITKDCIQAAINFDSVAVICSDHSLWLLHPFTSRMCMKLRKKRREGKQPYWDEKEFGPKPKFKKFMENAAMVSATAMLIAVVKTDGTLWIWDRMEPGYEDLPNFIKITDGIKTAEAGEGVLLTISQRGTLLYWKKQEAVGYCGQTPEKIMEHVTQISLGARHSAAVDEKHQLWIWGDNTLGQLGTFLPCSRKRPVRVMKNVRKVSLGYSHTGVLDLDRQIWMCGFNGKYEALGNRDMRNHQTLRRTEINGLEVKDLDLWSDRTIVLSDSEEVFGWG